MRLFLLKSEHVFLHCKLPIANCRLAPAKTCRLSSENTAKKLPFRANVPIGIWHLALVNDLSFNRTGYEGLADAVFASGTITRGLLVD